MFDLNEFISEYGSDVSFQPNAYYDKHLDCIRVRIRDCSTIEERLSPMCTILKPSHSIFGGIVGFNIKGVRHLFEQLNLPKNTTLKLTELIDAIVKIQPDEMMQAIRTEMVSIRDIEIKLDYDDAIAA